MQTATATVAAVPEMPVKLTLQQSNIARVQSLVAEFQAGNPAGYLAGVADDIRGSVLGGLIPGGDNYADKAGFTAIMEKMPEFMEVSKFAPSNWHAVNNDVLFTVDWTFVWKPTGKEHDAKAFVRKVLRDGMICEKYHCIVDVESITGDKTPVHDQTPVTRVQALLAEYGAGRPEGYLAGCADDFKGSVLAGLLPDEAATFTTKEGFAALMPLMGEYMTVEKFEPCNFVALPNNEVMFQVNWKFLWLPTAKAVETTAIVRKVFNADNNLCEKYHMCDCSGIKKESPREVMASTEA